METNKASSRRTPGGTWIMKSENNSSPKIVGELPPGGAGVSSAR